MKLTESIRLSWRAITSHKLRSSLTTIGVIIGVGSVIVFMVLGGGFEANIINDVESDNETPGMWVNTQSTSGGGFQIVQAPIYTESDVEQLRSIDGVKYVSPEANMPAVQLIHEDETQTGGFAVQGATQELVEDSDYVDGEPFAADDEMVVTEQTARLVEGNISVGDDVEIVNEDGSTMAFTVVGIIEEQAAGGQQATAYIPLEPHYNTAVETPDGDRERAYASLVIVTEDPTVVSDVKQDAIDYFEGDQSDAAQLKTDGHSIEVQTVDDAIDQITDFVDQLTIFIGGIAGISLVVGSIGIANIMIVSVTERTREIGIMKAIGARKRDIVQLFMVESIILGAFGALLGVAVGLGFGYLGVTFIGWPMAYPLDWVGIAVGVGIVVGILSGLYPAWSAARVDPIEALRRE